MRVILVYPEEIESGRSRSREWDKVGIAEIEKEKVLIPCRDCMIDAAIEINTIAIVILPLLYDTMIKDHSLSYN